MYTSARRVNFVALGPCTFIKQTPLRLTKYLISSSKRTRILLVQLSWSLRICSGLYLQLLSYFTTVKISFTSIVQLKLINKLILKKTLLSFGLPKTLELVDQFFISSHWVGAISVYQQEDKPSRASIQQPSKYSPSIRHLPTYKRSVLHGRGVEFGMASFIREQLQLILRVKLTKVNYLNMYSKIQVR